jgi:hypothetical protein
MKVFSIIGLVIGLVINPANHQVTAKWCEENQVRKQSAKGLELSLVAQKRRYKPSDQFRMDVILTNTGRDAVYILSQLDWGYSASLVIHVFDASGKEIQPQGVFDDHTFVSPGDQSAFVKLLPHHFLGTNFFTPLEILNLKRPGKYAIFVEYHSPLAASDVKVSPFWSREDGTIKSNTVIVEVIR